MAIGHHSFPPCSLALPGSTSELTRSLDVRLCPAANQDSVVAIITRRLRRCPYSGNTAKLPIFDASPLHLTSLLVVNRCHSSDLHPSCSCLHSRFHSFLGLEYETKPGIGSLLHLCSRSTASGCSNRQCCLDFWGQNRCLPDFAGPLDLCFSITRSVTYVVDLHYHQELDLVPLPSDLTPFVEKRYSSSNSQRFVEAPRAATAKSCSLQRAQVYRFRSSQF